MAVSRNDSPGNLMGAVRYRSERSDQDVAVAWIESYAQPLQNSVGASHRDQAELGNNRFAENETHRIRNGGKARVRGGSRSKECRVPELAERRDRQSRQPDA